MSSPTAAGAAPTPPAPPPRIAQVTPESRGLARDEVRLLVSSAGGHAPARFLDLPSFLRPGDLLVVNRSATLPASLPARRSAFGFTLNLCTRYGPRLWLAEPRPSSTEPGPLALAEGEEIEVGGLRARVQGEFPGIPRLRFVEFEADPSTAMRFRGQPIRYGYLAEETNVSAYQTIFADRPGSCEMPSAGRPFSPRVVSRLEAMGVELARITLHAGVSSLETGDVAGDWSYPEPFEVEDRVAARLDEAARSGRRIIAVGTTVVRALASSWNGNRFTGRGGMTRLLVKPGTPLPPLAGLLTGFHEPEATHLLMLKALAGDRLLKEGYREAHSGGYLWHEFGDSHLILTSGQR